MARAKSLREQVADLKDSLHEGIVWNKKRNRFDVVWTKRQLANARRKARSLWKRLNISPASTRTTDA